MFWWEPFAHPDRPDYWAEWRKAVETNMTPERLDAIAKDTTSVPMPAGRSEGGGHPTRVPARLRRLA